MENSPIFIFLFLCGITAYYFSYKNIKNQKSYVLGFTKTFTRGDGNVPKWLIYFQALVGLIFGTLFIYLSSIGFYNYLNL